MERSTNRPTSTDPRGFVSIPPDDIGRVWLEVVPMLEPALEHGDDGTTTGDVWRELKNQRAMLWLHETDGDLDMAVVLTEENRSLYAWLIGGHGMDRWLDDLIDHMRRYAKENRMVGLKAVTRPGLARTLRKRGWRTNAEIVRTEV